MGVALYWGTGPALFGSIISALYINFYYVPPKNTFSFQLAQDDDLVALIAFLVMSVVVGQLSARAQKRADENQKLYQQLRVAFEQASQLEGLKRSERFKSVLLDTVTHDLRTPLTSIKAAATSLIELRLLAPDSKEEPEDKLLHIITKQADRLNQFIEEMIEFAKLESHSEHRSQDLQPVEEIITNALARAEEALAGRSIMVNYDEHTAGVLVPKPTSQVLYLLLENASKHSPENCSVQLMAFQEGNELIIAVEDEGPGITPELREKIFEKFFRLNNANGKEGSIEGLGLGLAIAKGITETQGGKIWIEESTGPTGARFLFSVPIAHTEEVITTQALPNG